MPSDVVLVTTRSFGTGDADPAARLRDAGLEVVRGDPGHDPLKLSAPLADAVGWIAGTGPIGPAQLERARRLRVIARFGTGTDAVDVEEAERRGIVVARTPGANAAAVADHAVALMLAALRQLVAGDRAVRGGDWSLPTRGRELGALTVGIVGLGAVGRGVAERVRGGFGSRVLAYDPYVDETGDAELTDLDALVAASDIVTLHLPGGAPLVDAELLSRFKPGAVLVNTARGSLLDEAAVARALAAGRLGAAAVDVLAAEPAASSPLLAAPNVIVTPHVAAQTVEAVDRMGVESAAEVLRVLAGEAPANPVHVQETSR